MRIAPRDGLASLVRPHRGGLLAGVCCGLGLAIVGGLYAFLTGPLLQTVLSGGVRGPQHFLRLVPALATLQVGVAGALGVVAAALVGLALLKGLLHLAQAALIERTSEDVGHALRVRVFEQLMRLPLRTHRERASGELLARLLDDTRQVRGLLVDLPLAIARESAALVALALAAIWTAPRLALLALLALPPVVIAVARIARRVRGAAAQGQVALGELASRAEQALRALREIKSCRAEAREVARFSNLSERLARAAATAVLARALGPLVNEVSAAGALALTLGYGAWQVRTGAVAPEALVSFIAAVLLTYRPIKGLTQALHARAAAQASRARLGELLGWTAEPQASVVWPPETGHRASSPAVPAVSAAGEGWLPALGHTLELTDLRFRYAAPWVLDGLALRLRLGEIVGVVGRSGAGKSTLADLLAGLERWEQGALRWDGQVVGGGAGAEGGAAVGQALRAQVALVPQQPLLLDGTLAENLRFAAPGATEAALWEALREAGLESRAAQLPQALQTRLGSGGEGLSVGEVQRLAVARALLRRAPVLLLDEPTAALDAETEDGLLRTLDGLRVGRAMLLITHRPVALGIADRVLRLEGGQLRELPRARVPAARTLEDGVPGAAPARAATWPGLAAEG
ncbi:MAG: ABC transporter ATP-binding protein [Proteobacteria bacterium]|nr:ABC transporter ATP-binding protein [Pseudomonadota bacterium]